MLQVQELRSACLAEKGSTVLRMLLSACNGQSCEPTAGLLLIPCIYSVRSEPGKWSQAALSTCTECEPSKFGNSTGCFPCPVGTDQINVGMTYCDLCSEGTWRDSLNLK